MSSLYHYTCDHGRAEWGDAGTLLPTADRADVSALGINAWPSFFVWLTDQSEPDRDALGLTQNYIECDRTVHRYRVADTCGTVPWLAFCEAEPQYSTVASLLESPGADPSAWWVSREPVPVTYDPIPVVTDLELVSRIVAARWSA